jgi:hypothetical protein
MANQKPLPIRTDVSPALRPEIIEHRSAVLTGRSQGAFTAAKTALEHLYKNASLAAVAKEEAYAAQRTPHNLRNLQLIREGKLKPTNNVVMKGASIELALPPSDARALNEAMEFGFRRTMAVVERSTKQIVTELETLHSERAGKATDPQANSPKGLAIAAELRSHLKGLPNAERVALIREEIKNGNARLADAVCSAESFLSGLDPITHKTIVAETHTRFAPVESEKIDNLVAVLKSLTDAGSLAVKAFGDSLVPVVGADASASAALSALKTGGE